MHTPTLLFALLAASPLTAQLILHNVAGPHEHGFLGHIVCNAGDGDGISAFVVRRQVGRWGST